MIKKFKKLELRFHLKLEFIHLLIKLKRMFLRKKMFGILEVLLQTTI